MFSLIRSRFVRAAEACAGLAKTSDIAPLSETIAQRFLKLVSAPVAQWVKRCSTDLAVPGSIPT